MSNYSITLEEFRTFHTIDRKLYARLTIGLGFDLNLSKRIMAFWLFLERCGCRNLVVLTLNLPYELVESIAKETILCLKLLYAESIPSNLIAGLDGKVRFLRWISRSGFSIQFVKDKQEIGKKQVEMIVKEVCDIAFGDIVNAILANNLRNLQLSLSDLDNGPNGLVNGPVGPLTLAQQTAEVVSFVQQANSEDDRTLFLTFSKGHPISREELNYFLNRILGDSVEAVYMKIEPQKQPLFARVVVKSSEEIAKVLGGLEVAKFSFNGKDVWIRRFVSKQRISNVPRR
ncbi:hypothetical protein UlMin_013612 [Ulmus minor]